MSYTSKFNVELSLSDVKHAYEYDQLFRLDISIAEYNRLIVKIDNLPVDKWEDWKNIRAELVRLRDGEIRFLNHCFNDDSLMAKFK
jgi:hypothetical protein